MNILVLDTLIKQTTSEAENSNNKIPSKSKIPRSAIERIINEYRTLAELEKQGYASIDKYLNKQNGKKLAGAENIFKYRLSAGDRILYTYGRFLPYIKKYEPDSLVLIGYSNHDEQGLMARNKNYKIASKYKKVSDIVDINEITKQGIDIEDLYTVTEWLLDPTSIDNHAKYIISEDDINSKKIEDCEVSLTPEQGEYVDNYKKHPQPTLILGGGGCGKTLIAIHTLKYYNHSKFQNNVYFTQSKELRNKINEQYKNISWDSKLDTTTPNILDINDFCLQKLGNTRKQFIQYKDFDKFIKQDNTLLKEIKKAGLNIQDIWAEIRGTIKGSMQSNLTKGIAWQHAQYANQDNFDFNLKPYEKYLIRQQNKKEFILNDSIDNIKQDIIRSNELSNIERENLKKIFNYFSTFNPQSRGLSLKTYLELSEEKTTLEAKFRNLLYKIYENYIDYCNKNNLFDENDLVCKMFQMYGEENLPKFDLVIIDEIQDYSELQIYLIYKMCKDSRNIIFAGDSHQMINPTMFSIKRLKELFYDKYSNKSFLEINHLGKNFRCTKGIIQIANNLSEARRDLIGKKEIEEEQLEDSSRDGEIPFRLDFSSNNLQQTINEIVKYPSTVILVPDENTKQRLINLYGKENYEKQKVSKIFTVAEIKGMEYKYVVCFNLIFSYKTIWEQLFNNSIGKKTSKYRYYFNLIYVAITRSQSHLCFIDEECVDKFEEKLKLNNIADFNKDDLLFTDLTSSSEEWLKVAQDYEIQCLYDKALEIYENQFPEKSDCIYRCLAHIDENNKEYSSAIQHYMLVNDIDGIKNLIEEIKDENIDLYNLGKSFINPSLITYNNYSKQTLLDLINKVFHNKQEASQVKLYTIKRLSEFLEKIYQEA